MTCIRSAEDNDFDAIWEIFRDVVSRGDTYAYEPETNRQEARRLWLELPRRTFVITDEGVVQGTYYLKTNQPGPGAHVCNCGYMVASEARGKGLATLMCKHSQKTAIALGYTAMQFNFVASSNTVAVKLWQRLGFDIVGCLPGAFNHPQQGYVDAFVMYKRLAD